MFLYYHHSIFCKIGSKMGRNLKSDRGNSDWNIYKNCEGKLNALYVFSVTAIHKLYFIFKSVEQFVLLSQLRKSQS